MSRRTRLQHPDPVRRRSRSAAATAAVLLVAAAGCGSDEAPDEPPETEPVTTDAAVAELPANPEVVILQHDRIENQPDPLFRWRGAVDLTVTAGGEVIGVDPDAGYQPVAPLVTAQLSPDGVAEVLAQAREAGLYDPLDEYGVSMLADATTTVFRTADDAEVAIYDLDSDPEYREAADEQFAALELLETFEDDLRAWTETFGEWLVDAPAPYQPERVIVVASSLSPPDPADELVAGLLESAVTVDPGTGTGDLLCAELAGEELDAVWPQLADPSTEVPFDVAVRPLIPDEPGCDGI